MSRLTLHIGQCKTGSTSIQKTLEHTRRRLIGRGILYPATGGRKGQHGLLMKDIKRELHKDRPGTFDADPLLDEIAQSGCEHVVISCEGISGVRITRMEPLVVAHMLRRIGEVAAGHEITMVCYCRRQDEAIESRRIQMVKGASAATSFDLDLYLNLGEALDYAFFQSVIAQALPQARIAPRCFSRAVLEGGDVARAFCKVAGLDGAVRAQDILQDNVSPGGASIGLQLALNLLIEVGHNVDPIIRTARRMSVHDGTVTASVLDQNARCEVMDFFADSNARFMPTHVPPRDRAKVREHFAAPVSARPPNVTVTAQTLARAIVHSGAAFPFEAARPWHTQHRKGALQ